MRVDSKNLVFSPEGIAFDKNELIRCADTTGRCPVTRKLISREIIETSYVPSQAPFEVLSAIKSILKSRKVAE
jgi:hypothetical protein